MGTALTSVIGMLAIAPAASVQAASPATVVVAQGVNPTTLDPMHHQEPPAANVAINVFDTLLERDGDLKIAPLIAES